VLLNVSEDLRLEAAPEEVWKLLRDTQRLAGLLPGVESVTPLAAAAGEAYAAKVVERVGPFKVSMNLEIQVTEMVERELLKAAIKGGDSMGMNRLAGTLQAALTPANGGTQMRFEAAVEVLGKLATLGAPVVRRKTTDLFAEFARRIQRQFAESQPASGKP
jgi:carbon monoxide dehydrogenase subunit G